MKYLLIIFLFSFFMFNSHCQTNLVPNGDFSDLTTCPTMQNFQITATNWYMPTQSGTSGATSDNYHICSSTIQPLCSFLPSSIPYNCAGYQFPKVGDGYGGFIAYETTLNNLSYKEYLGVKLISPLDANRQYCISFYVSLSDSSAYSVLELGAFVSDDSLPQLWIEPLSLVPVVVNQNMIVDTENWTLIEGQFIANGGEEFLFIGSYGDYNSHTLIAVRDTSSIIELNHELAYYYLDDVHLVCCDPNCFSEISNVFSPNNDGENDLFSWEFHDVNDKIVIYNRWGIEVAILDIANTTWDGKTKTNNECSDGVYYYVGFLSNNIQRRNGYITLLR